jgi:general secretion pathway protein C
MLLAALVALASLGGCRPSASPGHEGPAPLAGPAGALDLRDAPVTELVGQLAGAVGMPVTVDTDAVPLTRCARVTLVAPLGTPRPQLVTLATDVLRSAALSLTNAGDHLTVARIPDVEVPQDCRRTVGRLLTGASAEAPPEPSLDALLAPTGTPPLPVEGIRLLSENTYEVDPDSPTFAEGPAGLMRSGRVIPHTGADGAVDGLRLFGIRRSSALGALGFQNGDTVLRIHGQPIASPDSALEIYTQVRTADRVEVELERRGQPLTLVYVRRSAARRPAQP